MVVAVQSGGVLSRILASLQINSILEVVDEDGEVVEEEREAEV
jgi:hypothetical protein